jgi:hypothetical protein
MPLSILLIMSVGLVIRMHFARGEFHQAKLPRPLLKKLVASPLPAGLPLHRTEVNFEVIH